MDDEVSFFSFFYWCKVQQFDATWVKVLTGEAADRAGISGARRGYTGLCQILG